MHMREIVDAVVTAVIWCVGTPVPQGSKSAMLSKSTGKMIVLEGKGPGRAAHKQWRAAVARDASMWCEVNEHRTPWDGPVSVDITFWLPPPARLPRWRWLPWTKPDIDKLARSVLDSISGSVIIGDSRVTDLACRKRYAPDGCTPGARIAVSLLPERDVGPDVYAWSAMYPPD